MKKILFSLLLIITSLALHSQGDTRGYDSNAKQRNNRPEIVNPEVIIFPVPVKDNRFTIRSDRKISSVKVTNIIGQEIFRSKYNDPQQVTKVILDNAKRGMYLVTIIFHDDTRIVKKIMVEIPN
jgi:calcineurin-like phosphoesterase